LYCCMESKKRESMDVKYWEIIADNLKKAAWSRAASQRLILKGERSGLQTRIAATESLPLRAASLPDNPALREYLFKRAADCAL